MAVSLAPQLLLVLDKRKRGRDSTNDALEEAHAPAYVRLRWDAKEMGTPSVALRPFMRLTSGDPSLVFRRVESPAVEKLTRNGEAELRNGKTALGEVHLQTVGVLKELTVVLDCSCVAEKDSKEVFLYDEAANQHAAQTTLEKDLLDMCASVPSSGAPVVSLPLGGGGKRRREVWDDVPEYVLRPRRRQEGVTSPAEGPSVSAWDDAAGDLVDDLITELSAHLAPWEREEALHEEYLQGIYFYPDHRLDDEYDSNAEDFDGNEYPDESRSDRSPDGSCTSPMWGADSDEDYS